MVAGQRALVAGARLRRGERQAAPARLERRIVVAHRRPAVGAGRAARAPDGPHRGRVARRAPEVALDAGDRPHRLLEREAQIAAALRDGDPERAALRRRRYTTPVRSPVARAPRTRRTHRHALRHRRDPHRRQGRCAPEHRVLWACAMSLAALRGPDRSRDRRRLGPRRRHRAPPAAKARASRASTSRATRRSATARDRERRRARLRRRRLRPERGARGRSGPRRATSAGRRSSSTAPASGASTTRTRCRSPTGSASSA